MKRMETKKSHSCWWNSHISPRNLKWLSDNIHETDRLFNEMLKLIEEDGDSFAQKAQMYYQRRPELVSHVEGFYRMYRAIAERYDNITTELVKNIPPDFQSQSPTNGSEFGTEAASPSLPSSPDRSFEHKSNFFKPHPKAAGFEFFLGFGEGSDRSRKGSDESSSESGSDCYNGKVLDDFVNSSKLETGIIELGTELHDARDKHHTSSLTSEIFTEFRKQIEELQAVIPNRIEEINNLKEAMEAAAKRFDTEISHREDTITMFKLWIDSLLNKFEQISDQKSSPNIQTLAMEAESSNMLISKLEAKISSLLLSASSSGSKVQWLEERVKQLEAEKNKLQIELNKSLEELKMKVDILTFERDELNLQVVKLIEDIECWDDESRKIDDQLHVLHAEHAKLVQEVEDAQKGSAELRNRVKELEDLTECQRAAIVDCAEGKKEAIRQLCFSLEHYRNGYQELRQNVQMKFKFLNL